MTIIEDIQFNVSAALIELFGFKTDAKSLLIQKTRKEFTGDFTLNVFPYLKASKKSPELTADEIGKYLVGKLPSIRGFNIIKGFLNLEVSEDYWLRFLEKYSPAHISSFGGENDEVVMVEFSSPNTNKPLHLGHIRNNLLGSAVSNIIEASGKTVKRVNLVNDRGIHICKSMLAWQKWGNGETPESSGIKGDHLAGKYYVIFNDELKKEIEKLKSEGLTGAEAESQSILMRESREMLAEWEGGNTEILNLWKKMNEWVYEGFDVTYKSLGIRFDRTYYESETYLDGKSIVKKGLENGAFYRKPDNSVWIDMTNEGLDEKLLLRPDGTSVYITQDLGTAVQRFVEFNISKLIYVVGNEQNYHFDVLKKVLARAGYPWHDRLYHLSYGMVELPEGKMKSREGTVVDADDLIDEMFSLAAETSGELGKLEGMGPDEVAEINRITSLGALKYFILKVDPKKNMIFNPKESIDFNGNTGVFIQYAYTRINSLLEKAAKAGIDRYMVLPEGAYHPEQKEISIIKQLHDFIYVMKDAADTYNPSLIANYSYELAKEYNQFYHDFPVLKGETPQEVIFRLKLSETVGEVIKYAFSLLGIECPSRM